MYSVLMVLIFVLGYVCIALEHPIKIDKAATALLIGVLTWTVFIMFGETPSEEVGKLLGENFGETAQTLFFLFAAMTIVEIVDRHNGFVIITDKITATSKVKLLWIIGILTFFMSSVLDNLTTTIVILSLLRKLIDDQKTRWTYASIVVIAANAGGAWSPIGDVTTIMLWIGGQISALGIMKMTFLPSMVSLVVPLAVLSFTTKGAIEKTKSDDTVRYITTRKQQVTLLILGIGFLLFVPIFKTITHLPPFLGMLLGLGVIWCVTEIMHRNQPEEIKNQLTIAHVLKRVDTATIFFFLGILTAVGALGAAGQLGHLSEWLKNVTNGNIYIIDTAIGLLSSVIDNVPLVAATMEMYPIQAIGEFAADSTFWNMLAFCAGTGGSILIIGSAAGVAAMGLEKIDFIWYLKHISWLALLGYFAGVLFFIIGL